jgi:hypothetical protein
MMLLTALSSLFLMPLSLLTMTILIVSSGEAGIASDVVLARVSAAPQNLQKLSSSPTSLPHLGQLPISDLLRNILH